MSLSTLHGLCQSFATEYFGPETPSATVEGRVVKLSNSQRESLRGAATESIQTYIKSIPPFSAMV